MKKLCFLFVSIFAIACCSGCDAIVKSLNKQPAEPAQFESAAKANGFSVSEISPATVNEIQEAESAQLATKNGCNLYFAIYDPHYFDSVVFKTIVNGKEVKNDPNAHSREEFVNALFGNRNSNRSSLTSTGTVFIKSSSDKSYYFYAGNISNTLLYIDGPSSCRDVVEPVIEAINY